MAHKDAASLAKLFKANARGKLLDEPKRAAKDAGATDELGAFLAGLSRKERETLVATWEHMSEKGATGEVDGETVAFL